MTITPVNVSVITAAVKDQLQTHPDLTDVQIERSEDLNIDPNVSRWVGIYRSAVQYQQRVLGFGGGVRDQRVRLLIVIVATDQGSGEACEIALESLIATVVGALLSDTTLRGTVGAIEDFEVGYDYQRSENVYTQTATLQLVAVGNTTAQ